MFEEKKTISPCTIRATLLVDVAHFLSTKTCNKSFRIKAAFWAPYKESFCFGSNRSAIKITNSLQQKLMQMILDGWYREYKSVLC